jgi:lipid-binding SYLF domain-containing protein
MLILPSLSALAGDEGTAPKKQTRQDRKREKIDTTAKQTLERLFQESPKTKELYAKAHGYAVFEVTKVALGLSGGGGTGVAVKKEPGERTYMKMGTGGVGLGLGGQVYQVVFLFQDSTTFSNFVNEGWAAEAQANAVAGSAGANAEASFTNGLAVFQLTKAGLMLRADITGTRYWKHEKLNR